jgi:hypothetical protein
VTALFVAEFDTRAVDLGRDSPGVELSNKQSGCLYVGVYQANGVD